MICLIDEIRSYMERVFPLPRSLTGEANRETLRILRELVPLTMIEYPSGMRLYDEWVVPDEWCFKYGWTELSPILGPDGRIDLEQYEGEYSRGSMTVGEYRIPGRFDQEYLVSTYICHPATANDNCSGMVLTAFIARELAKRDLNYWWRIVWVPETIGAIAYLFNNEAAMQAIDAGLVVTCVAGPNEISYKLSFDGAHRINHIVDSVLCEMAPGNMLYPFNRHGSDERQYSSQGFGINCCSIHSDKYYTYPEYHTSADNLGFISYERMEEMLGIHLEVIGRMDRDLLYTNLRPFGEPMLGARGLYGTDRTEAVLVLLQAADGETPLSVMARDYGMDFDLLSEAAERMVELGLLEEEAICRKESG